MRSWIPIFLSFKATAIALALTHHRTAALVVWFAPDPWLVMQFLFPAQQGFGRSVTSFETSRREVWLTIDDGPDPDSTPRVLELLKAHGARATFFVVGSLVEKHPELVRRIVAEGHSIGNHTHTHPMSTFWCASPARTGSEIDQCVAALLLANVPFERYFRPPVGIRNPFLDPQLTARGMTLVLWNARGFDGGTRSPESAFASVASRIRPGGIVLAHEGAPRALSRIRFLTLVLEYLDSEGYSCVLPPKAALRPAA